MLGVIDVSIKFIKQILNIILTLAIFFLLFSMNMKSTYTIKYVASKTGLKPYLIRSWEARYQAICPQRSDSNRRCFTDNDVKRLRLLKKRWTRDIPFPPLPK
jgi:hypothetical protein